MTKLVAKWLRFRDGLLDGRLVDAGLLIARVSFGALMAFNHGWGKIANFEKYSSAFADPFGIGPAPSLALAAFAEFFCSLLLALGLATRLALTQLIVTMCVAVFYAHGNSIFGEGEKALLFLLAYVTLIVTGPGRYSIDAIVERKARAAEGL